MSSKVMVVLLVVALVFGAAGWLGTQSYIASKTRGVYVLIAGNNIVAGQTVSGGDLEEMAIPENFASFASEYAVASANSAVVVDRTAMVDIDKGEPILYSHFDPLKTRRDMVGDDRLGPEDRAISLSVSMESSVANILEPGDHVDIIGTFRPQRELQPDFGGMPELPPDLFATPSAEKLIEGILSATYPEGSPVDIDTLKEFLSEMTFQPPPPIEVPEPSPGEGARQKKRGMYTRTILENVEILGVGQRFAGRRYSLLASEADMYSIVTVKVSPVEAEVLVFAKSLGGSLTLAFRPEAAPAPAASGPIREVDYEFFESFIGSD